MVALTRQAYNLFHERWNRSPILMGGEGGASSLDAKAAQTDRETDEQC